MDTNQLSDALTEVRKAQRLLVSYHKRVLPLIKDIAGKLDCHNFYQWDSSRFNRPAPKSREPFSHWEWDMSPLSEAFFLFFSDDIESGNNVTPSGWMLEIRLVTDTAMSDAFDDTNKNWDPYKFSPTENSETQLQLYAYKSLQDNNKQFTWYDVWYNADFYPTEEGKIKELKTNTITFGISSNLAELSDSQAVSDFVEGFKDLLQKHEFI